MDSDVVPHALDALATALALPVLRIQDAPASVQKRALAAVGPDIGAITAVAVDGQRFLACRYHQQRAAVIVAGPYRTPADGAADAATCDPDVERRAADALSLMARALERSVEGERQRAELANQFEVTSRAVLAVTSELSLDTVLRRIVDLARELSDARYAALGVPAPSGDLEAFLTSGLSDDEERRIGLRPRGLGVLGLLLREPRTMRLDDLRTHPAAIGFPKYHPIMKSFLGVPIISRGRVLGNFYPTEKRTGDTFTESDARLVEVLARHAAVAIENAQLYREIETQRRRLGLVLDQLPEATVLAERDPERVTLVNRHVSELLGWTVDTPMLLADFMARNQRMIPDGAVLPFEAIPMVRSLRGGEVVNRVELRIERPDGRRITALVNSAPLLDQQDNVTGSITVFQDITKIKDAEQLKDDFLSLVSHELRTPLTTIHGGALILQREWDALDRETCQMLLDDIANESRRLETLIENMMQLASIRAGRLRMETEPVHMQRLIERAVERVQHLEPRRRFEVAAQPNLLAEVDAERIDQVLRNLLQNAIKYSPPETPIEVACVQRGETIQIGVRDYGPGIDDDDLPAVFDRFARSRSAVASGTPGMGLGLYLSRHVVEAHGGNIQFERPKDGGALVLFTVPAIRDDL